MKQQILLRHPIKSHSLKDQDFYELCLLKSTRPERPGYVVAKYHVEWSEIDKNYMFSGQKYMIKRTCEEAEKEYMLLQQEVIAEGYAVLEVDMFAEDELAPLL